ncbi:DUF983 domain-containing protein [Sphingomicrobium lutaoense]|uniref:Uncharacterized protein (DUF983 family) n=1 Tax=Sphingomicrobium lutaoense TaxID=515949 RepID=A0A839Z7U9_9SPHN|nr:DUF983 domain-containing protein [Sphingomicrobium lutaoense]MBB3764974.1 uncharacterized protein (DUF983 family) [Sphingomicrobium lutaoense]
MTFGHHQGGDGPTLVAASVSGLCPRCGARTLFSGAVALADACRGCGLDYRQFNVGDGPAAFLILIIGAIIAGAAIWLELGLAPPFWVHSIWLPLLIGMTLLGLRLGKAALLVQEYRTGPREGRLRP